MNVSRQIVTVSLAEAEAAAATDGGLSIETDPSSPVPGEDVEVVVRHPDPTRVTEIRLLVTSGQQSPGSTMPGNVYTPTIQQILTFQDGVATLDHPIYGGILQFQWVGINLGTVTIQPDLVTLKASYPGRIGVAGIAYKTRIAKWTVSAIHNTVQGILALDTEKNLAGFATLTYDDGRFHPDGAISLDADPSDPAVESASTLKLYATQYSYIVGSDANYDWTTTFGVFGQITIEDEEIVGEEVQIENGVFDVEKLVVAQSFTWYPEPGALSVVTNDPPGSNHFTASVQSGLGTIDYTTKLQQRTITAVEKGAALIQVAHPTDADRTADVIVRWGDPPTPKDPTITCVSGVNDTPVTEGCIFTLAGYGPRTTNDDGQVTYLNVAIGRYQFTFFDPQGNYQARSGILEVT